MTTLDDSTRLVDQVAAQHVFPSVKHGASTSQSIAGMTKPLQFRESPLFSEKVGRLAQTAIANTKGMSRILLGQQEYTVRAEWPTSQNVSTATPETGSGTVDIAGATDSGPGRSGTPAVAAVSTDSGNPVTGGRTSKRIPLISPRPASF